MRANRSHWFALPLILAGCWTGSIILSNLADARPKPANSGRRFVSAQAYHHFLRAELALTRAEWEVANDELQLALVYDPESVYLHGKLVRLALAQGHLTRARKYVRRATLMASDRVEVLRLDGAVARAEGRLDAAERIFRTALKKAPRDLDAGLALADVLTAQGRSQPAVRWLKRLSDRHPQSGRPLTAVARLERAAGRWSEAVDALARAAMRGPLPFEASRDLADGYERVRRLADAESVWLDYIARQPDRQPESVQARLEAGRLALAQAHRAAAEQQLRDALQLDPTAGVGRVYLAEGADREAIAAFERSLARDKSATDLRYGLGRALARQGRLDDALGHLGRIPSSADIYVQARLLMSRILMRQGKHQRAELALEVALDARPQAARLHARYADVLSRRRRPKVALQAVQRAREELPAEIALWSAHLRLLDGLDDDEAARDLLVQAATALPEAARWRLEAERALRGDDPEAATERVTRWVRAAPRDVAALIAAARAAVRRGRSGRPWAVRAVAEAPRNPEVLAALGVAEHREGRHEAGLEHLRRAVRLDPWSGRAVEWWGDAALAAGERAEALRAYSAAARVLRADLRALDRDARPALNRVKQKARALRRTR